MKLSIIKKAFDKALNDTPRIIFRFTVGITIRLAAAILAFSILFGGIGILLCAGPLCLITPLWMGLWSVITKAVGVLIDQELKKHGY